MLIQLLHTCLIDHFAPGTGMAIVRVLERLGFSVRVPPNQTCCGQPAYNAGFTDEARIAARHTIQVFEETTGPIVIPSGSCGDMVIHQYETLFRDSPEWLSRARAVSGRCREFSSLVAEQLTLHPLDATLATTVTYHASCHLLRGLGVDSAPKAIIGRIAAARVVRLEGEDECCGFGGLFAVKHDAISARMLDRKLDAIARSGASRVVTCDAGCLLHIEGGLHRRGSSVQVQHLGEVLDEAAR